MTMQTDVLQGRLNESGWIVSSACRIKGVTVRNAASGIGRVFLFDSASAPVAATYARSTTTVTVTATAHGLKTGDYVGIGYVPDGSNRSATCGQFQITKTGANTFTITDPNTGTVSSSTVCYYVPGPGRWLYVGGVADGDVYVNYELLPGEGIRAKQQVYAQINNLASVSVYYG